ncbi:LacI family DNA-binding transcriptional regulator [Bifidobacterium oedipodis]|uniref:LacI family transcriptional regulator n=1 Tax=Bifidobacterium oedipodis TaxID=2675322 RepID=A0A7Y0EQ87_9BIFI|nr:LacI family DNA-binding transcriptional regulator [Bifidobacterium sp. DSM 109957]NMM94430.1 LacI family transcriptional regulator [Bifidobacterium sp. DSM 109957]
MTENKGRSGPAKTGVVGIRDVAQAAGVSVATVSRVVNGGYPVGDSTRKKVNAAISRLGYVPNRAAATITSQPQTAILVQRCVSGGTYADMAAGVESEARRQQLQFHILTTGGDWTDPEKTISEILSYRPRLVVMTPDSGITPTVIDSFNDNFQKFKTVGASLVMLAWPRLNFSQDIDVVDYENEQGAYELTKYMISLGHRHFAFMGLNTGGARWQRYQGFLRALSDNGIDFDETMAIQDVGERLSDMTNTMTVLRSHPEITAIVGSTDELALHAMAGVRKMGLNIPQDISVGGFDDLDYADDFIVPLTTVHASYFEMGEIAVKLGLDDTRHDVTVPTRLVIRASVMPPTQQ